MAYQTGLLKARGRRKGQNRFWPVAAGTRQNWAGCCRLPKECARAAGRRPALVAAAVSLFAHICTYLQQSRIEMRKIE